MAMKNIVYIFFICFVSLGIMDGCATDNKAARPGTGNELGQNTAPTIRIEEFILGSGDTVEISVYRHDDLKRNVQVDPSGKISYPLLGDIMAGGMSIYRLRDTIRDGLSAYIVDPQVTVSIASIQSKKVYVLGEVSKPGVLTYNPPMSIVEAISMAGGFTLDANKGGVIVMRENEGEPQLVELDVERVLEKGELQQNIQMKAGDVVYIPPTFIADASRLGQYLKDILWPIIMMEQAIILGPEVGDALEGKSPRTERTIVIDAD
ncbi:MAG: polysaccharide biosynthesis/export family protein [Nitrospirota bacterium]